MHFLQSGRHRSRAGFHICPGFLWFGEYSLVKPAGPRRSYWLRALSPGGFSLFPGEKLYGFYGFNAVRLNWREHYLLNFLSLKTGFICPTILPAKFLISGRANFPNFSTSVLVAIPYWHRASATIGPTARLFPSKTLTA